MLLATLLLLTAPVDVPATGTPPVAPPRVRAVADPATTTARDVGPSPGVATPPSFVVIVADDFGVDLLGAYGEAPNPPCTPFLDAMAREGMLFRNAWANPTCSPTRAALLTGRHGFRTGVGQPVSPGNPGLAVAETTLPEALPGYASAWVGKWHLAPGQAQMHPNASGFDRYAGALGGALPDYSQWTKVVDGVPQPVSEYATRVTTDDAVALLGALQPPFLLCVGYNAPHAPFHAPPAEVCPAASCASTWCDNLPPNPTNRQLGKAMVEAMDAEIGRLLAAVHQEAPEAYVIFLGDNGTARQVSQAPFVPAHAKDSLYEGGVNVPLLVRGPHVLSAESAALVSVTDVFATLADLAAVPAPTAVDSVSFAPCFGSPWLSPRSAVYAERFTPNGPPPWDEHERAVRGPRFKLIREDGQPDELYDLLVDPFETTNLLPGLSPAAARAYDILRDELAALGVD